MTRHGVYVWLQPDVWRTLLRLAEERSCSLGKLIEHLVMAELERRGCEIDPDELRIYRRSLDDESLFRRL